MYKSIKIFALMLVALSAASCVTQKKMTYMQDANPSREDSINAHFEAQSETVIRCGDALTIFVSALDKEAVAPYNLPAVAFTAPGSTQVQTTPMLMYYIVDEAGDVEYVALGRRRACDDSLRLHHGGGHDLD